MTKIDTHDAQPDWADAPEGEGWNWLAQDADGRWFWYRTEPRLNWSGGVWRSNSRNQQFALDGVPRPDWDASMQARPGLAEAEKQGQ